MKKKGFEYKGPNPVMLRIAENASKALVSLAQKEKPTKREQEATADLAHSVAGALEVFYMPVTHTTNVLNFTADLKRLKK